MTTHRENPWRAPWKACRWYEGHGFTGDPEDYGYEPGDELPAITHIEDCDGKNVASAHDLFTFDEAKARLMAASPDLLEALELILSPSPHYAATKAHRDLVREAREKGLAAIAKARGEG